MRNFESKWGFLNELVLSTVLIIFLFVLHCKTIQSKRYSMVVQAVVDHDYLFRDIGVRWSMMQEFLLIQVFISV